MDRALWLLLGLRLRGWLRRVKRMLTTVKGLLATIVAGMLFTFWMASLLLLPTQTPEEMERHLANVREIGPLALLGFCLLNYFFAAGERVLAFTPAEVNLLFPAPLSRRQLLIYKIVALSAGAILLGLFMGILLRTHSSGIVAGMVGVTLAILFLQYFALALALLVSIIGARAYGRQRRLVLGLLVVGILAVVWLQGTEQFARPLPEVAKDISAHPVMQVVLGPFTWQIMAMTADTLAELALWGALSLLGNLVLLAIILGLDAHYLEAAAASSEKIYRRMEKIRRGGMAGAGLPTAERARWSLPSLPRWGGVGPLIWRQFLASLRSYWWMVTTLVFVMAFMVPMIFAARQEQMQDPGPMLALIGMMVFMVALFMPSLLAFDFRADVDRMEVLKTLPLPAWRVVVGQLLAPVLLVTLVHLLILVGMPLFLQEYQPLLLLVVLFLAPINFLAFAMENLFFLWFPTRQLAATPGDIQNFGRVVLLWLAKFVLLMTVFGVAGVFGLLAYLLAGGSFIAGGVAAWLIITACAVSIIPLLCLAFNRFDVASDTPP